MSLVFNATFSNIVAVSFIGGRNWSTQRKPQTRNELLMAVPRNTAAKIVVKDINF
jgi:hypothetical protein